MRPRHVKCEYAQKPFGISFMRGQDRSSSAVPYRTL